MERLETLDRTATELAARYGLTLLSVSMGIIFVWFGALKLDMGLSPAEPLIRETISFLPIKFFLPILAIWEMVIGLGFLTGQFKRATILLLLAQMGGAMSPIILAPDRIFNTFPYSFTLEGQYVVKDIVLISVGIVIWATVRGGGLSSKPVKK
ncbi:MAG: hypothetical protein K8I82_01065 [Anaerolineae bacterium]|nr:hypothetical protein [Anaerolineae bacterium]